MYRPFPEEDLCASFLGNAVCCVRETAIYSFSGKITDTQEKWFMKK